MSMGSGARSGNEPKKVSYALFSAFCETETAAVAFRQRRSYLFVPHGSSPIPFCSGQSKDKQQRRWAASVCGCRGGGEEFEKAADGVLAAPASTPARAPRSSRRSAGRPDRTGSSMPVSVMDILMVL